MGRRPLTTTKSGKYMNPVDQQRKLERRKMLKMNRNMRNAARKAVLRDKDIDDLIEEMNDYDKLQFSIERETKLTDEVIESKRSKLLETANRVISFLRTEDKDQEANEAQKKLDEYKKEHNAELANYLAVKFASNPNEIPLPEYDAVGSDGAFTPEDPPVRPSLTAQVLLDHPKFCKKEFRLKTLPSNRKPPGPPAIHPQSFECSEEDSDDDSDDDEVKLPKKSGKGDIRDPCSSKSKKKRSEERLAPTTDLPQSAASKYANPPPPPALSSLMTYLPATSLAMPMYSIPSQLQPQHGTMIPPMYAHGTAYADFPSMASMASKAAVITAAPNIIKKATISAEPKLRNLQKEITKLVPATLMRKKYNPDEGKKLATKQKSEGERQKDNKHLAPDRFDRLMAEFLDDLKN